VQSLALPLSAPLIFGYIVSLIGVSSGHASLLVKVLAYLPPTAPFAMPTLVGFGEVTWWQFELSVVVSVVCTVLVALVAARIYARPCSEPADGCGCASWSRPWPSEGLRAMLPARVAGMD
jgi:ABC-2 type transport system permease protein